MKKYIIFLVSFILLFFFIQLSLGVIQTAIYTPDISEAWNMSGNLSQEAVIFGKGSYFTTFLIAIVSAIVAYSVLKAFKRFSK